MITFCEAYGRYSTRNGVEACRSISVAPLKLKDHHYLEDNRHIFTVLHGILERGNQKQQFHLPLSTLETTRMIMVLIRGYSADWAKRDGEYDLVQALHSFITVFIKSLV